MFSNHCLGLVVRKKTLIVRSCRCGTVEALTVLIGEKTKTLKAVLFDYMQCVSLSNCDPNARLPMLNFYVTDLHYSPISFLYE